MIHSFRALTILLLAPAALHASDTATPAAKPNIVYMLADDLGWGDLSANGGSIPTPQLDRLFAQGVRLDHFMGWCVCSPTRAMLLTGRHPFRVGTGPAVGGELAREEMTIAEAIQAHGYAPFKGQKQESMALDFKKLQLNVVRVFLQVAVYEAAPHRFLENLENLLSLCAKHQLQLMPVLFDSCFDPQSVDLKDYHDKKWMPSPGFSRLGAQDRPAMERYIHAVVGGHKDDRRIVLWDVMNEPESTAHYGDWERGGRATIDAFVRWSLRRVKEEKPTQPLTIGWAGQNNNIASIDLVDVICIHHYCPSADIAKGIREAQHWGRLYGKPVILNEFIGRPQQPFAGTLPIVAEQKIGWCFWELMIGRTQFAEGASPYQGLVYPDGTCYDADEVAAVAGVSAEVARQLFPERPLAEVQDDDVTYRGHWTRWTGEGPLKERLFYATSPKSSASFEFSGDHVTCIHKVGPDCGLAEVLIDGKPAKVPEIDTYAPQVEWNHRTELAASLAPGKHVVTVRVAARKNPASTNCFVQIVGFATK